MQYKNVFKVFAATYMAAVALAKDNCQDIKEIILPKYDYADNFIERCEMNRNGEVTALTLNNRSALLDEDMLKDIFSFSTITDLAYSIEASWASLPDEYILTDFYIDKLKKLEKFSFDLNIYAGSVRGHFVVHKMIDSKAFKALKNVKDFSLSRVDLTQDNINAISELTNLRKLQFHDCVYAKVNYDVLANLKNLTKLQMTNDYSSYLNYFRHHSLEEFPSFVFSLSKLNELVLSGHQFIDIPDEFSKLKNLGNLNLVGNRIYSTIPESINTLTKLKYANFIDNINLYEKALTNASLKNAKYNKDYDLCKPKDANVEYLNKYSFKDCSSEEVKVNQCKDVITYLHGRNPSYDEDLSFDKVEDIKECRTNQNGEITVLSIENQNLTKEEVEKIIGYKTITSLVYSICDESYFTRNPEYDAFPDKITKLFNLRKLTLSGANNFGTYISSIPKNFLKKLKGVTELEFETVKLSNNNIKELATLTNLNKLSINYCSSPEGYFTKLNNLCKKTQCYVNEELQVPK